MSTGSLRTVINKEGTNIQLFFEDVHSKSMHSNDKKRVIFLLDIIWTFSFPGINSRLRVNNSIDALYRSFCRVLGRLWVMGGINVMPVHWGSGLPDDVLAELGTLMDSAEEGWLNIDALLFIMWLGVDALLFIMWLGLSKGNRRSTREWRMPCKNVSS